VRATEPTRSVVSRAALAARCHNSGSRAGTHRTRDNVMFRVNFVAQYDVADLATTRPSVDRFPESLSRGLQFGLRDRCGQYVECDDCLARNKSGLFASH
jgi:regulator of protease activity HflC (stomatin/prohibitin superfamily)